MQEISKNYFGHRKVSIDIAFLHKHNKVYELYFSNNN